MLSSTVEHLPLKQGVVRPNRTASAKQLLPSRITPARLFLSEAVRAHMCAVSVIMDYWSVRPDTPWTRETFDAFKVVVEQVDALDTALGEPECHDPSKAEWMKRVEDRLSSLESHADSK